MQVPIFIRNPKDGEGTFTKIRLYRSDDNYAASIQTVDIDLTNRDKFGSGYTVLVDLDGAAAHCYKVDFYNPDTGVSSEKSEVMGFGQSVAINFIRQLLKDTDSTDYVFTDAELASYESQGVDFLSPELLKAAVDTSKTIVENTTDYDLPVGAYNVTSVFKGTNGTDDYAELDNFSVVDDTKLRLESGDVTEALPLEIHYRRAYRNIGEVPPALLRIVTQYMLFLAYTALANDRGVKFKAFQALQRENDIRPESLAGLASAALTEARRLKDNLYRG